MSQMTPEGAPRPFQPEHYHEIPYELRIVHQLESFLQKQTDVLRTNTHIDLKKGELERREAFLSDFFAQFIQERTVRADEVESPRVQGAIETIKELLPYDTFGVFCVDGRIMPSVVFGFPGGFGGFMRTPSGDLSKFRQKTGKGLRLMEDSPTAKLLEDTFAKRGDDAVVCQILDSHVGCAARGGIEHVRGHGDSEDGGLFEDVMRKQEIARAMVDYVKPRYGQKRLVPVQFSFDPHDGYGYMGLEKSKAIKRVRDYEVTKGYMQGYSKEVLAELSEEGVIISTKQIASELSEIFDSISQGFDFQWESKYEESVDNFWGRMKILMNTPALEVIEERVRAIFGGEGGADDAEIRQRAVLLLANSFNGYLQNGRAVESHVYPTPDHTESCIVIQEQGFGPHGIKDFSVFPGEYGQLPKDTVFASGIVRANRAGGAIKDFTGQYPRSAEGSEVDNERLVREFVAAPVPVVLKGIIRGDEARGLQESDWERLNKIEWDKMPSNWHEMGEGEFRKWLERFDPAMPSVFTATIDQMRRRMVALYDGGGNSSVLMAEGSLTVLPVLVDASRRIRAIIPFIHEGYEAE